MILVLAGSHWLVIVFFEKRTSILNFAENLAPIRNGSEPRQSTAGKFAVKCQHFFVNFARLRGCFCNVSGHTRVHASDGR